MTEAQVQRRLKKIDRLKKDLRYEKQKYGGYDDSSGRRYAIMELYLELKNPKKTNRYLSWFNKTFPSDVTYLRFKLGAALTKFELKKYKETKSYIVSLVSDNTYIIDLILKHSIQSIEKYEWSHFETLIYAKEELENLEDLMTTEFREWLNKFTREEEYIHQINSYIEIMKKLKGMEVSDERTNLLNAKSTHIKNWMSKYVKK